MRVWSLGREDALEEGTATHPGILFCRIPWTGEVGGLQSIGSPRVGHNWSDLALTLYLSQIICWMKECDSGCQRQKNYWCLTSQRTLDPRTPCMLQGHQRETSGWAETGLFEWRGQDSPSHEAIVMVLIPSPIFLRSCCHSTHPART